MQEILYLQLDIENYRRSMCAFPFKSSSLIIGDINENNPNILTEVGVALGLDMPILLLLIDNQHEIHLTKFYLIYPIIKYFITIL